MRRLLRYLVLLVHLQTSRNDWPRAYASGYIVLLLGSSLLPWLGKFFSTLERNYEIVLHPLSFAFLLILLFGGAQLWLYRGFISRLDLDALEREFNRSKKLNTVESLFYSLLPAILIILNGSLMVILFGGSILRFKFTGMF
jgi:hypothetical protein